MIDFTLPAYEWQESMDVVFQNVNLYEITITNEKGILFNFLNSYDGKYCGSIQCKTVWKSQFELDSPLEFAIFICDVRVKKLTEDEAKSAFLYLKYGFEIPSASNCYLICMDSGEVSFTLLCKYMAVITKTCDHKTINFSEDTCGITKTQQRFGSSG